MDKPHITYDEISDTIIVSFEPGAKATGIELNEHILLRIDKEHRKAIGITFLDYSLLAQKADFGPRSFPVTGLTKLSEELRELVLDILQKSPVSDILALSTYTPSYTEAIPITSFHNIPLSIAG
ncbi:MAG: DUF2283 domain-containing protein [Syntrophaceae bacterium]|nr:DUF2283 domain-containing protein [Syntrophaceae bacterium]